MTVNDYFMSNFVFVPARLDSEGSIFKNNCIKSNKHRPTLSVCRQQKCRSM